MAKTSGQFRMLMRLIAGERCRYAIALVALLLTALLSYVIPLVPQAVLDVVLADDPEKATGIARWVTSLLGGAEFLRANLWFPAVVIAAIAVVLGACVYLRQGLAARAAQEIALDLRKRLYDHVQKIPCRSLEQQESGDLLQRCTSDLDKIVLFLSEQVIMIGRAIAMVLVPLPLMLAIDWRMTLVSMVLVVPISAFSYVFFTKMRRSFLSKDEAEGRLTATVNENLAGIRVVRAFARQTFEQERFEERNREHRDLDNRLYVLMARFWSTSDLLCFTQQLLVLGFGLWWLSQGSLEVGAFYFFLSAVMMFLWPVRMMGRILAELGKALVAIGRIDAILALPLEQDDPDALELDQLDGSVRFEDVSFSHGELPVLDGMDFAIEPGETIALLGPSGSGKTTIVDLLLRLHEPGSGTIHVGGHPTRTIQRGFLRSRIAVVMQQPFLYSRTIGENIAITTPGISQDGIESAAIEACIHDSIRTFDEGYDTIVGERGITLSGGQRQRVAIARALIQDPSILVLDDALSAVDTETERIILDAIRSRRGRQTTILIAHRLSTLREADRILVLDNGRIQESGTHESLLARDGFYSRLWRIQTDIQSEEPGGAP